MVYAARGSQAFFVKVPLGPASAALVENEARALALLAAEPSIAPLVPRAGRVAGHLAVEDLTVRGAGYRTLSPEAVRAVHDLLYARSATTRCPAHLRADWKTEAHLALRGESVADHPAPIRALIAGCRMAADAYLDALAPELAVECYVGHGDLTQWNVLATRRGEPRIIDWEMFGLKPRYFDLIHYFVSADLLLRRADAPDILRNLDQLGAGSVHRGNAASACILRARLPTTTASGTRIRQIFTRKPFGK